MRMPFGKHRGMAIQDLPPSYCHWVVTNCDLTTWPGLKEELQEVLDNSGYQPRPPGNQQLVTSLANDLRDIIKGWYPAAPLKNHPDRGGTNSITGRFSPLEEG